MQFLRVGPLDLSAAERTGNGPAGSAGVLAFMRLIQLLIRGDRAYAEFLCFLSAWLPSAFFMFPAIEFHRHPLEFVYVLS